MGRITIGLACVVALADLGANAFAAMPDANNVKKVHKGVTVGCTVCHSKGNFKELNSYGTDYNEAGRNVEAVKAINAEDSDEDGVSNADELAAGTNPGDAKSK